jgi:hypothetical protein
MTSNPRKLTAEETRERETFGYLKEDLECYSVLQILLLSYWNLI